LDDAVHEWLAVSSFSSLVFEVLGADDGGGHNDDNDDNNNVWRTIFAITIMKHYIYNDSNETLFPNWQKESWQTFEKTSGHVRPERVNKWPNSMTDI